MRKFLFLIALCGSLAVPASAQRLNLDFPGLAERASEVVDVTLDASMLRLASQFLSGDKDERAVRDIVGKLEGIYVRSYEFDKAGEYDPALADRFRAQLGPSWKRIVNVQSRKKGENVEVYTQLRGEDIVGLVVISAEPRELTLVNIVGPIDLEKLTMMDGKFGIPRVNIVKKEKP